MKSLGKQFLKHPITPSPAILSSDILSTAKDLTKTKAPPPAVPSTFNIPQGKYQSYIFQDANGKVDQLELDSSTVTFLTQYGAGLNLYKMLEYLQPEAVVLQVRPDDIFTKNFKVKGTIEEHVRNVHRAGVELMPSVEHYETIKEVLDKKKMEYTPVKLGDFSAYQLQERVHDYSMAYANAWGIHTGFKNFFLADLPRETFTRQLLREHTLMQLQSMFTSVCRTIQEVPDIIQRAEPHVPMTAGYKLYPQMLLAPSDRFMAEVIKHLAGSYKSVLCVLGTGQADTVSEFIKFSKVTYSEQVEVGWEYTHPLSTETSETAMEKLALLDIMSFGFKLPDRITSHNAMKHLKKFTQRIAFEEQKDSEHSLALQKLSEREDYLTMLYLSMLKKYKAHGVKAMKEGRRRLKSEFLKTMLLCLP